MSLSQLSLEFGSTLATDPFYASFGVSSLQISVLFLQQSTGIRDQHSS
jgi:hypothetical protein